MAINKVDVVILAGAPADAELNPSGKPMSRAMIDLGHKTMLQWVVDALRASPSIGKILAVGDVSAEGLDEVLEPGDSLINNVQRGITALGSREPVLIVSSDIPLLTSEAVEDFLQRAESTKADMAYPILPRSHCEKRYPGLKRTYLKTADGIFTGGNIMLVHPRFVENNWETIQKAYAARKHITKLARMIGLGVLVRVIVGQALPWLLTVSMLERAASRMLGARVAAVVSAYPEIGEDVDKPSDLAAVRSILLKSSGSES